MISLVGNVFDRLTVVSLSHIHLKPSNQKSPMWNCSCICGNSVVVSGSSLKSKSTRSCGCLLKDVITTHGMSKSTEYAILKTIKQRCLKESCASFSDYGGAGITICDRWLQPNPVGFNNFLEDMGRRPEGTSLNRVQGSKVYSKETCEWATLSVQSYDQKMDERNTSGRIGVCWDKARKKWKAEIKVNKKHLHLGRFDSFEEACKVRQDAEIEHYGFSKENR